MAEAAPVADSDHYFAGNVPADTVDGAADSKDGGDASASWKVHSGLRDRVEGGGVR